MRNNLTPLRPGFTALAAVLALSATPVFAQSAETAPAQDAPVISAPPASAETAPVTPDATAPLQSSDTSENTSAPVATAMPMATRSPVVVHTAEAPVATVAPVTKAAAPKHATVTAVRAAHQEAATPAPAATPRVTAPAPTAAAPAAVPSPAPAPAAVVKTSSTTSTASDDSRELELAGIGAVGLLALIGGAFALSRRKRDEEEEVLAPAAITMTPVAAEPVAYETLAASPVTVAPVAIEGAPTTALHEDFDLSRYGAHVQAAYRGPTEDNPSLSLRQRLKRARFMDQRARENGGYGAAVEPAIAAERKPVTQNLFGSKFKDGLRSLRPQGGMRPAFS